MNSGRVEESRHRGIAGRLVTDGVLNRFVNIYVGDDVRFAGGLHTPLTENAIVTILPVVVVVAAVAVAAVGDG